MRLQIICTKHPICTICPSLSLSYPILQLSTFLSAIYTAMKTNHLPLRSGRIWNVAGPFAIWFSIATLLMKPLSIYITGSRSRFDLRAGSTFPVPVCTVLPGLWVIIKQTLNRTSRCKKVDAVRLYASYRCRFTFTQGFNARKVNCSCV